MTVPVAETEPLYQSTVREIREMIDRGTLRAGDRVPSIRQLRRQTGRSVSTVLRAYQILDGLGLIEARPQSGYYVKRSPCVAATRVVASLPSVRPQSVNVIGPLTRINRQMCDPALVPLGGAHPGREMLPTRALLRIDRTVARTAARSVDWYEFPAGGAELHRAIAREYVNAGCALSPEDLVVTCGAQEALSLCLRAVAAPGDVVAVESPAYFGVLQALEAQNVRALEVPTDPVTGIDLDALDRLLGKRRVAALIICGNAHNPLGYVTTDAHKRRLVEIITRHEVPTIEDDVYADLCYAPQRPSVCKAYDEAGLVMLCSSFSKTLAPGMRIGWCAPGRWRERVEQLKFCTTIASPTVAQQTIARYMDEGGYHRHLRRITRVYETQTHHARASVLNTFPEGTTVTSPAGGFVIWIAMPAGVDAMALQERAARDGISIAPGPIFSATGQYRHHIRLSLGFAWNDRIANGIAHVGALAKRLATDR